MVEDGVGVLDRLARQRVEHRLGANEPLDKRPGMRVEHARRLRGIQPLALQHRVRDLGHVPAHFEDPEVAEPLPTADHERLYDVLVREPLPQRGAIEVARHACEDVGRRAEEGEALVCRRHALQPPRHTVAVEDLAVARPRRFCEPDGAGRRDVEKARERAW